MHYFPSMHAKPYFMGAFDVRQLVPKASKDVPRGYPISGVAIGFVRE